MDPTQLLRRILRRAGIDGERPNDEALNVVAGTWEALARSDPLWAVLSHPDKRARQWKIEEFLRTGEEFIDLVLDRAEASGMSIRRGLAVDFGCGVGRLTGALGKHFGQVVGIDVSETMVRIARDLHKDKPNVRFELNRRADLRLIASRKADFVCSHITLQHLRPSLAEAYIKELFRIVRRGGCVYFQMHSHLFKAQPLPPEACRVEISVRSAPAILGPGSHGVITAAVRNISPLPWLSPLTLGNHWRDQNRQLIRHDDGRTELPQLASGEAAVVKLAISAPDVPGSYELELDLVQEGVRWFVEAGSALWSVPISVDAKLQERSRPRVLQVIADHTDKTYALAPDFEMHGIRRDHIEILAHSSGMSLVRCDDIVTNWVSHEYLFRKNT